MGVRGQYIGTSAAIDTVFVRFIPGSLVDTDHTRHDALGNVGCQADSAAVVEDIHQISVADITGAGILGVDPDRMCFEFSQPGNVVPGGVGPGFGVGRQ